MSSRTRLVGCFLGMLPLLLTAADSLAAAGSTNYVYDGLGRLKSATYESGTGQSYTYDAAGNRQASNTSRNIILNLPPTANVTEGQTLTVTVTRTGATSAFSVGYSTADGTATAGRNYTATSGTLNFAAGQATQTFPVVTLNDGTYDGPLTFNVRLNLIGTTASSDVNNSIVTINEVNPAPSFSIGNAAATNEGSTQSFTVTRTNPTSLTQAVSYATADGSAVAGMDYNAVSSALIFSPSDTSQPLRVQTLHVPAYEGTRSYSVSLSNPTQGAVIGTATVTGAITDVDPPTSFAVNSPAVVNEGATINFTVSLTGGPAGIPLSVNYATGSGTAISGTDFTPASGTLSFAVGDAPKIVPVTTIDNRNDTTVRTFTLSLSGATNGAPIGTPSGTGSIQAVAGLETPTISPRAQRSTTGSWSVSWTSVANATRYELIRTDTSALLYSGPGLGFSGTTTTGLAVEVRACNASSCGSYSGLANITYCPNNAC